MRKLLSLLLIPCLLAGSTQAQTGNWAAVEGLNPGDDIWVKTKDGHKYQGQFDSADPEKIVLWSQERSFPDHRTVRLELSRDQVQQVRRNHRLASAGAGAAIGVGIGVGLGAAIDASAKSNEDDGLAGAVFGMLGGALGAILGKSHPFIKSKPVYIAP